MKNKRQDEILDLISKHEINTQEKLRKKLANRGFHATQATVSRDIRELKLIKAAAKSGGYKYVAEKAEPGEYMTDRFTNILREAVKSVDTAMNIVVVNVYSGMGSGAGAAIDMLKLTGVVGSVAGDDTLILLTKSPENAEVVRAFIKNIIK